MGFWDLMVKKDDMIVSFVFGIKQILDNCKPSVIAAKRRMSRFPLEGNNKDLYILLNAPSLKTQDISVLYDKNTMFVNRGFMHPMYKVLQPKYHVFADPKMLNGIWPVTWLDEIWNLSPNTKIILPVSWCSNPIFAKYKDSDKIYWTAYTLPFHNLGVSGDCFNFAIQQKFDKIYFSGFDATGIGHEMVKTADSHFYGNDKELENKSTKQFVIDLLMHSRHLHDLNRLADWCNKKGYNLINITNGGLLDMFPREKVLPIIENK